MMNRRHFLKLLGVTPLIVPLFDIKESVPDNVLIDEVPVNQGEGEIYTNGSNEIEGTICVGGHMSKSYSIATWNGEAWKSLNYL